MVPHPFWGPFENLMDKVVNLAPQRIARTCAPMRAGVRVHGVCNVKMLSEPLKLICGS